ncbi:hypothetical protein B0H10DRAFT_2005859 [Mycena sp. CBHHK59/15]|nr:hypothetical protein B0H10DRAFT_2005859 [Mycena sp. CBHHK59/15]
MSSELDDELLELVGASSDKEKQTRKRPRDAASGKSKASSKKSKKRKLAADSDNEPESEDSDGSDTLYPLEGKYIDEADRAELLQKTEVEREEILTARLDDKERIRDRKYVEKLRAQQLAGVAVAESDTNAKRPARATGRDKTKDRTLSALKAKRKAKDEKKRTSSPKPAHERSSSPMDMDMSSESDSEDGQITRTEQEDERLFGKPVAPAAPAIVLDNLPVTLERLAKLALTRDVLAKYCISPWFEEIAEGAWVRYLIGQEGGVNVYRICQIKSLSQSVKPYKITPERTTNQVFELKHGKAEKVWQMDRTSNEGGSLCEEFLRLMNTCKKDGVPLPTCKEVDDRYATMQKLMERPITENDVTAMIARRRGAPGPGAVAERARLIATRTLAFRRQDYAEVAEIDAQLALAPAPAPAAAKESAQDLLARVNERNRRANMEAVRRAEVLEAERRRRERRMGVVDPSARLRTVPRLFENKDGASRPATPTPALTPAAATPTKGHSPAPTMGGKTFEAAVIESIEVDLGDF